MIKSFVTRWKALNSLISVSYSGLCAEYSAGPKRRELPGKVEMFFPINSVLCVSNHNVL
jgi:hypothetical protein